MASSEVKSKLLRFLKKGHSIEQDNLKWMNDLKGWIQTQCTFVQMYVVKGSSLAWLVMMPSMENIEAIGHPYVRILIDIKKRLTFEVLGKVVQEFEIENAESKRKTVGNSQNFSSTN